MSVFRAFVKYVVVLCAATGLGAALFGAATADAAAAPYPPSEPCSLTASVRGVTTADGSGQYDVLGSGLGAVQPVRVVLATTGQQVGATRTDSNGSFRTVVTAPRDADASLPDLTATSPQQTCTWTPPGPPPGTSTPASSAPGDGSAPNGPTSGAPSAGGNGGSAGNGSAGNGSAGNGGRTGNGAGPGAPGAGSSAPGSGGTTSPSSTTPSNPASPSASSTPSKPPLAEPSPGTETPFGIGLGIAAVLLVLGTLAVLLLTRRPER